MESELETREMLWNTVLLRFDYFWKTKTKRRGKKKQKTHFFTFFKFRAKFKNGGKKFCRKISQREKFWRQKISDVALNFEFLKKTICILKNFWDELVAADVAVNLTNFRIERFSETEPRNKVRVEKRAMMRPGNVRALYNGHEYHP